MKTGHCLRCDKYSVCKRPCRILYAELNRVTKGKGRWKGYKKRIIEIPVSKLDPESRRRMEAILYGDTNVKYDDE